jgi:hypothetical protein
LPVLSTAYRCACNSEGLPVLSTAYCCACNSKDFPVLSVVYYFTWCRSNNGIYVLHVQDVRIWELWSTIPIVFPLSLFSLLPSSLGDPYFIIIRSTLVSTQLDIELTLLFTRRGYSRV